jgi:hypothetical protein
MDPVRGKQINYEPSALPVHTQKAIGNIAENRAKQQNYIKNLGTAHLYEQNKNKIN